MEKEKKQQLIIKICCVITSFCLWIYIANINNPIRTRVIKNIKVNVINTDALASSKLLIIPGQDFKINLTVKGLATDIYNVKPEEFKVSVDLASYAIKKGENKLLVEIKDSPENVTVLKNESMWINVEVDNLKQKTVPIRADIEGNKKNYLAEVSPLEAIISGTTKYVDQVEYVRTISNIEEFKEKLEVETNLEAVDKKGRKVKYIDIKPSKAKVIVLKKSQQSKQVKVKVNTIGTLGKNLKLNEIIPEFKVINIEGEKETLDKIENIDTEPIDLSTVNTSKKVNVKFSIPKGITAETSEINVDIKVDIQKNITKTLNIPINIINLNAGYNAKLDNNSVIATVSGSEEKVNAVAEKDIKCSVDLKGVQAGEYVLDIKVESVKDISTDIEPKKVKVIITKDTAKQQEDDNVNKNK